MEESSSGNPLESQTQGGIPEPRDEVRQQYLKSAQTKEGHWWMWPYLPKHRHEDYRILFKIRQLWRFALSLNPHKSDEEIFKDLTFQKFQSEFTSTFNLTYQQVSGYAEFSTPYQKGRDYFNRNDKINQIIRSASSHLFKTMKFYYEQEKQKQAQRQKATLEQKFKKMKKLLEQKMANWLEQQKKQTYRYLYSVIQMDGFYLDIEEQMDYFIITRLAQMWIETITQFPHKADTKIFEEDLTYQKFQSLYQEKNIQQKYSTCEPIEQKYGECDQYFLHFIISRYMKIRVFLGCACSRIFSKTQKHGKQVFTLIQKPDDEKKIRDRFYLLKSILQQKNLQGAGFPQLVHFDTPFYQLKQRLRLRHFQIRRRIQQQQRQNKLIIKKLTQAQQPMQALTDLWQTEACTYHNQTVEMEQKYKVWRALRTQLLIIKLHKVAKLHNNVIQQKGQIKNKTQQHQRAIQQKNL